ncbi:ras-associating and dilute domain-containing protein [Rhinatrema bivittatum]|uniref:ras-associating and dilute domain-containing protein n=1 Tax=Rhinatrema bivittatum TaxID=194408 RepID=UPI00112BBA1E|nr:ras-associating and dilute domain-containing protein [Rhinatrema bivittatum]XP_029433355.1 ras-associating and dilute domain-containing protein [Rhinatrema bivittatum]
MKNVKRCLLNFSDTMFYGSSVSSMTPPSKNKLKRHSKIFTQVLYRTLSYRDRRSVSALPDFGIDDPAELSTQPSAPGVLKVFGGNIRAGTHYKSVLATPHSSAQELVKEALERYALSKVHSSRYVLCDVIGRFEGSEKQWQTECLRVLADNEKPLLIQDLWKPKEGFSRRFELRKRSELEELAAKEIDTVTAGINAQARKLQRTRAKGGMTLLSGCKNVSTTPSFRRTVSETSLNQAEMQADKLKRHYSTLPEALCSEDSMDEIHGHSEERSSAVQYSLYQCPHLLLLQGYNRQHDNLVYLLNREQYTVGQRTPSSKPSISLSAPDILPLHCTVRKIKPPSRSGHRSEEKLVLEPIPGASISVNFSEVGKTTLLHHGDLLSLGCYYLFLFKDPVSLQPLPASALVRLKSLSRGADPQVIFTCKVCGNVLKDRTSSRRPGLSSSSSSYSKDKRASQKKLRLEFGRAVEDLLLERILTLIEPGGDDHKLTPVFLLCLCIQHSATSFEPGEFGQLLLKMAKQIQRIVWDRTKELAEKQSQQQDPVSLSRLSITDLIPDLQHILFWMSNAIELLYFTQQKSPIYIQSMEEEMDIKGSKESLFSSTITASEEAMTVLEEVIMYTFQQCVYYISKSLYVSLPALFEGNSFPNESLQVPSHLPEDVCRVVSIYQATLDLLHQYEVHPDIASQMFAYLFFFSNTLLFNHLIEKGPMLGCFRWSKGIKIRACLRLLLEWIQNAGYGCLGEQFFSKLLSVASFLATPSSQLLQMTWQNLRVKFPALSCAQLHCVLKSYQLASSSGSLTAWQPAEEERAAAFRTEEVLESFDNHPPIILPSEGFKVDLDKEALDDNIYRHLLYIRHFLWSLRSKSSFSKALPESDHQQQQNETPGCLTLTDGDPDYQTPSVTSGNSFNQLDSRQQGSRPESKAAGTVSLGCSANGRAREFYSSEERLKEKLRQLQLQSSLGNNLPPKTSLQPLDSSCLLTPPNTPSNSDQGHPGAPRTDGGGGSDALQEPRRNELNGSKSKATEGTTPMPFDFPTPASSSRSSDADDFCYVFVVELEKGPIGLGMGLIDGLHTPLNTPGIYIRTLIPDSPVASDGRLSIGDRILAVNGTSLIGADYKSAVDLIRSGGKKLRFLVAKSDMEIAEKISSGSSC